MTETEAINVLNMVEAYGLADEARKLAIDALKMVEEYKADHEKQIAKEPILWNGRISLCPSCHRAEYISSNALWSHCAFCGQHITRKER